MTAPALDLTQVRGPVYPVPGEASPPKIVDYVRSLIQDGDADALERYKLATRNLLFSDGRQHVDWSIRDRSWKELPQVEGRIRVTYNYIRPILRARMQRMMSAEIAWRAIPSSNDYEARDRATTATTLLEGRWKSEEMDAKLRTALFLAYNTGIAYLKRFWNPAIGVLQHAQMTLPHPQTGQPTTYYVDRDGQPLADEQGNPVQDPTNAYSYRPGDTDTVVRSLFNIRLNPDAQGLEPAEGFRWLIDMDVVPLAVVREKYGEAALNVQSVDNLATMRQYERIIKSVSGVQQRMGSDLTTGKGGKTLPDKDLTLLAEYWEAPTEQIPDGRLIVIAGTTLLFDGPLPYGFVPYTPVYDERRPLDGGGRATVDDLIAPQKVVNRHWGLLLEEMARSGIGQWAYFDVPGLGDQITNMSGAHIKIPYTSQAMNRGIEELVKRMGPGSVAPDRWKIIEGAKSAMYDIGAFHEISRGQVPPGVDSGIAVQLLQEQENGQLTDAVRTLKRSLVRWGRHTILLARWGYGDHEERWIPASRPDLGFLVENVTGLDLPDPDELDIDLEGFKPMSAAARTSEIKEAVMQGWIDPRKGMKLMDLGRGIEAAFESQTRHYARARRENLDVERQQFQVIPLPENTPLAGMPGLVHQDGTPFCLPADDDHAVHMEIHQDVALDDTKPWPLRQAMLLHINEHRTLMAQAQMAMVAAQQPSPKPGTTAPPNEARQLQGSA